MVDFNEELISQIQYFKALVKQEDADGGEIEEITKDILSKKSSKEELDIDDFVELEYLSMMIGLYNQEMMKTGSSIRDIYRLALSSTVKLNLPEEEKRWLDRIVDDSSLDSLMYFENGKLAMKDRDAVDKIKGMLKTRISESSLDERCDLLDKQYKSYLDIRDGNGKKEVNNQ